MKQGKKRIAAIIAAALSGVLLLSGCTPGDSTTVAVIGSEEITYGQANFFVRYTQSMYEYYYTMYGSDMETVWAGDSGAGDGTTMEEAVKDSAKTTIEEYVLLRQHMDEYEVSVSEEDETAIAEAADAFISANSEETLDAMNGTRENVENYLELMTVYERMYNKIIEDVDTEVSDEEALMKAISYVEFTFDSTVANADSASSAVESALEAISGTTSAAAKEEADAFLEGAAAAEDFSAYAEEAGYTATDTTIDADATTPSETLREAVWDLKAGETSGVIEDTDNSAYYVVRMTSEKDEDATETNKDTIVAERQQEAYDTQIDAWQEETEITWEDKVWDKISLVDLGVTMAAEDTTEEDTTEEETGTDTLSADTSLTVASGDTVNIDYVGTIDGVEFDGGNTNGAGADLTIGSGSYIDDFEDQLIGAHPGDTVEVNVTFPEDYQEESLAGKDAVFTVTVNGIYQSADTAEETEAE